MQRFLYAVAALGCLLVVQMSAARAETDAALGERLVREMWAVIKANDVGAQEKLYAQGFQTVLQDGGHDRDAVLKINAGLHLDKYALTDFMVTREGPVLIVSYFSETGEILEGEKLPRRKAARLTSFLNTDDGWKIIIHANLNPIEK